MRARSCVCTGAVARLSRRLDKAIESGDLDSFRRLMNRMMDIAEMRSPDCTPEAGHAAFRWLSENDGGLLNDAMRRMASPPAGRGRGRDPKAARDRRQRHIIARAPEARDCASEAVRLRR